jgi:hypothetical protein
MFAKILTIFTMVVFVTTMALAGNPRLKNQPKALTGDEPVPSELMSSGNPPIIYSLGPGDSIGYSYYDFGTNGSCNRNLINFGDGTLSFAKMVSIDNSGGWPDRGSFFKYFDGTSWSSSWTHIETSRRGWANIDQFVDFGGVEAVVSHTGMELNVDAAKGANVWTSVVFGGTGQLWPRIAIGSGFTIHVVYSDANPPANILYASSLDAGTTWTLDQILWTMPEAFAGADAYDITAQGSKVAAVVATEGGDVVVVESMDGGATWSEYIIYDIDGTLTTPGEEVPDGGVSCLYDASGNLHVAWGNFLSPGDAATVQYSVNAGIRHWSASSGVQEIAWPDPDPTLFIPGATGGDGATVSFGEAREGNLASEPDISADAFGAVYLTFCRLINEQDDSSNYYQHYFGLKSVDGGVTWSNPVDVTPGSGFDASYGTCADLTDSYIHFNYFCDPLAGNNLGATHENIAVTVMYLMIDAMLVDVKEVPGGVPTAYALQQNYPNPFNPTTIIQYSIPAASHVTLKVYDLLGREVATIVDKEQTAGSYEASFDANRLANGTYVYTLQAGSFTETRKMMVLK